MNFGSAANYWANWKPDGDALVFDGTRTSWSEFAGRTAKVAAGLRNLGIGEGDRVGILALNHPRWCELTVATLRIGAIVVPLNVRLTSSELEYIVTHAGCKAVAVDDALSPVLGPVAEAHPDITTIALVDGAAGTVSYESLDGEPAPDAEMSADSPAVIAYTSGTTGLPKGATLTHANLMAHVHVKALADGWTSDLKMLLPVPLAFTGGIINNFLATFGVGGALVLERDFVPDRALELMISEPINGMMGVPVMFQGVAAQPGFADADLSALQTAITGGAPVPESLLKTYQDKGVAIRQAYGLTEATGLVSQLPVALAHRTDAAGFPSLFTSVRTVDDDDNDVGVGEVGEIIVKGPVVMAGYWNDEAATAETMRGGWLHTGDLGIIDETGVLSVVDRKKDMVISGGLNVYPAEVERVISDIPGVVEVAAFGVPSQKWGESVAVIVSGEGIDEDLINEACRADLADYKTPKHVVLAEEPLPRSMSGKVLRRELRDTYAHLGD